MKSTHLVWVQIVPMIIRCLSNHIHNEMNKFHWNFDIFVLSPELPACSGHQANICLVHFNSWIKMISMDLYFMYVILIIFLTFNIPSSGSSSGSVSSLSTCFPASPWSSSTSSSALPWRKQRREGRRSLTGQKLHFLWIQGFGLAQPCVWGNASKYWVWNLNFYCDLFGLD